MPLRIWKCKSCGEELRTKASAPVHCDTPCELVITPPKAKFMEKIDEDHGKSRMVGQESILRERARSHSRSVELTDLIESNGQEMAYKNGWLKDDGKIRKKIDDL